MEEEDEFLDEIEPRRDNWDIDVTVKETWRVVFEENLTKEEAIETFMMGDYYDVIDEMDTEVIDAKIDEV